MKERRPKGIRGRPKVAPENVRRSVSVRLNGNEWASIQRKADAVGMTPTAWMRRAALSRVPLRAVVPVINRKAYAELARLAANLNQITRAANEGRVSLSPALFELLRKEVQQLRLELLGAHHDRQDD